MRDVGGVLGAWSLAFLVEGVSLLLMRSADPDAARGFWDAQVYGGPLALLEVSPFAVLVVGLGWLVARRRATVVGASLGVACGVVAFGISSGRHFANVGLRTAFVFVVAIAAFALARLFVRRLPSTPTSVGRGGDRRARSVARRSLFLKGLYPAFHAALFRRRAARCCDDFSPSADARWARALERWVRVERGRPHHGLQGGRCPAR